MILQEFWSKSWGPDMCTVTVTDSEANSRTESLPSFISERAYPIPISFIFCMVYRITVLSAGIELVTHAPLAQSPNHWTTREVPCSQFLL